jgi:hypothetical protein
MFSIVGNINFLLEIENYKNFFSSVLTVVDASLGNYSFTTFEEIDRPDLKVIGLVFTMSIAVVFNIVVLNFLIAVLADTYNTFESKSNGLYLSKILNARDEMTYEASYGAFLASIPPVSAIQIPFVPFAMLSKSSFKTMQLNDYLMRT